jgi:cell division protein FtsN
MNTLTDRRKLRGKTVADTNRDTLNVHSNKTLIIAVTAVVLFIIFMYFRDRQQQHAFELRSLEKRVELLEEWGMPRENIR